MVASGLFRRQIVASRGRSIPLYDLGVSAGVGELLDGSSYSLITRNDFSADADIALRIAGNSMSRSIKTTVLYFAIHRTPWKMEKSAFSIEMEKAIAKS
jgi:hypothetical protein